MTDAALAQQRADGRVPPGNPGRVPQYDRAEPSGGRQARSGARFAHYRSRRLSMVGPLLFGSCLIAVLAVGWFNRDQEYIVPDSGTGYWLGIAGGALMLLLLLYPLRKRLRAGHFMGTVAFWFRAHMILGLVGPALVLFHANFKIVSANSAVAMVAMLIVAGSGVIGRYLYGKVHLGLYGRKAAVEEILADAKSLKQSLGANASGIDQFVGQFDALAAHLSYGRGGLLVAAWSLVALSVRARFVRWRLRHQARQFIAAEAKRRGWPRQIRVRRLTAINELVTLYVAAVRKAAAFRFYDRLFGVWHVLHVPLFIILIIAACVHVVAAHFY